MSAESTPSIYLETERLILRRLTEDDVENLFELVFDPEVMRYLDEGRTHIREEIVEKVLPHYLDHYEWYEDFGFSAAIERGFTELLVDKVVADTLAGNVRSRRVMEASGMHLEAEFVLDADEFPNWDEDQRRGVKYALTKAGWESSR